jgi:sulfatase maturation enzyme AslB (radical SAM superfamily)
MFIARHFDAIGISIDGDMATNDMMRPTKAQFPTSADDKYNIPLREVRELKALRPDLRMILASVVTKLNANGLLSLAHEVSSSSPPIDLWKFYQFVGNNFRAKRNRRTFSFHNEEFDTFRRRVQAVIGKAVETSFRSSSSTDGSCLIVDSNGDLRVGGNIVGSVVTDDPRQLLEVLATTGAQEKIVENKLRTYRCSGAAEPAVQSGDPV